VAAATQQAHGIQTLERWEKGQQLGLEDLGGQQAAQDAFGVAGRQLDQARTVLQARLDQPEWTELAQRLDDRARNNQPSFDESRRRLARLLADSGIKPAGAAEIMQHYKGVVGDVRTAGLDRAMRNLHEHLGQASQLQTAEHDFGREEHSPLQWWQWLIIIGILVISVAVLLACLFWAGCAWIYAIWLTLPPGFIVQFF
jgi:hypothetical protein